MSVAIKPLSFFLKPKTVFDQIRDIFFLTSPRKSFASEAEREEFFKKWTDYYFCHRPEFIYVAFTGTEFEPKVLGYLMVEPDSLLAMKAFATHAHYVLFEDLYLKYPAHLHINCHPDSQGLGVGSLLIEKGVEDLRHLNIPGFHLITAPTARNVNFYRKNLFNDEVIRTVNNSEYLFMGRNL